MREKLLVFLGIAGAVAILAAPASSSAGRDRDQSSGYHQQSGSSGSSGAHRTGNYQGGRDDAGSGGSGGSGGGSGGSGGSGHWGGGSQGGGGGGGSATSIPELDPGMLGLGAATLAGGVLLINGRRRRKQ